MKRKILKVLVPVLVLAMLLQVPFALSASASALSDATSYDFVVSKAAEGAAGNLQVQMYLTTDNTEDIDGFGAALVLDANTYDFVNADGDIITDDYETTGKQVGKNFALSATAVDEGGKFIRLDECSLIAYNSTTELFYLFVSGLSIDGLTVDGKCEIAQFYLQLKPDKTPDETNIRKMDISEWRNASACPSPSIFPGAISSKEEIFVPTEENIVQDVTVTIDYPVFGSVVGSVSKADNAAATITATLKSDDNEYTTTLAGAAEYTFGEVLPGTYTLTLTSPGSLGFTINNIVVESDAQTDLPAVEMFFGDCNEDGTITAKDISKILVEFGDEHTTSTADVNGDGTVTAKDISIIILDSHFGISSDSRVINL